MATNLEKVVIGKNIQRAANIITRAAKDADKGVVGGYNGSFPLTAATKGNIYLLPSTQKYYVCITDYNGSQLTVPNANFEELSVYANRSKLDNLQTKDVKSKIIKNEKYINRFFGAYIVSGVLYLSFEFVQGIELTTNDTLFTFQGINVVDLLSTSMMENNQKCRFSFASNKLKIDSANGQVTTAGYFTLSVPIR